MKPTLHTNVMFAIGKTHWLARRYFTRLTGYDAAVARLLIILGEQQYIADHPLLCHELSDMLELTPSAFTRLVDRMVRQGLVKRVQGKDRRSLSLVLTGHGIKAREQLAIVVRRKLGYILNGIRRIDLHNARAVLAQIQENLEELTRKS